MEGEEKGEYTFIRNTGQSVIDYTIVDIQGLGKVKEYYCERESRVGSYARVPEIGI